jgi:RNA polymerase sigma factor (TIGR02999 family)
MLAEHNVTQLIKRYQQGDNASADELFGIVYQELRRIARQQLNKAWSVETIQATSLVNEAYLKLLDQNQCDVNDRAHFFALSATAMRQIIINYAEQKQAKKRGGDWVQTTLTGVDLANEINIDNVVFVDKALKSLQEIDPDLCQLVELRFFAGMSETEIAVVMKVTERTVRRNWRKAKALLTRIMEAELIPE